MRRHVLPPERRLVKIYGGYETTTGKMKRFGFKIKVSPKLSGKALHKWIVFVYGKLKFEKTMPVHIIGQTFPTFKLLISIPWIRIRKIVEIDVGVKS